MAYATVAGLPVQVGLYSALVVESLPHTSALTLAVGLVAMAVMFGSERFLPRAPAPLAAIGVCIAGLLLLGLSDYGVETVGAIPRGLPGVTLPDATLVAALWPGAAEIALMSFTETIAAVRAFSRPGEPLLRPTRAPRHRHRHGRRGPAGRHAGGRWHVADRSESR